VLNNRPGITVQLTGRFLVRTTSGQDITPRGSKSQALLALILTESNLGRTRTWLQDKLWSDRGPEQGSASLRQSLAEIRNSFGDHADLLICDRKSVSLDRERVTIAPDTDDEFLEGIDVRDDEFEHWLTAERSKRRDPSPAFATGRLAGNSETLLSRPVILLFDTPDHPRMQLIRHVFVDYVVRTLRENFMITVHNQGADLIKPGALVISAVAFDVTNDTFALNIRVDDHMQRGTLWSAVRTNLDLNRDPGMYGEFIGLISRLAEIINDASSGHALNVQFDRDANLLANIAVRKLFTIGKDDLVAADRLLQQAYEIEPRGVFQAWRAQIYTIQNVERYELDRKLLRERSEACCSLALAADPTNSNVLAAVANARMNLDRDYSGGGELALSSARANASNPLAWWSLSNAHLHAGNHKAAYAAAVRAQILADGTRLKFWGDFQRSLTAAVIGRSEEALRLGTSSNALAPNFRPALRYLVVFNGAAGKVERAQENVRQLTKREPGFSIDQLIHDKEYPAKLLHKTGLLDRVDMLELS